MAFSPGFLEELRARTPLGALIGRRVRLQRRGRELVGLCPFHNEKSPSFTVNEEKQFFHCFGCGAHGDAVGFVMRSENANFIEACEQLAAAAGLALPKPTPEARAQSERRRTILDALEAGCRFFEGTLRAAEGRPGAEYLSGRGLDEESVRRFRLGFAPAGRVRLLQALGRDFPTELLLEAGLVRRNEDGELYDYFRDRVVFPICDRAGRVIAFGGRTLGDGQPKYLNSPDTPVFEKGHILYGHHLARAAEPASGGVQGAVVVTEGYMDVIALQRAGFSRAVAPLGTALTEAQLELLWQLAAEPVLCFDGDAAGQRASARAIGRALPLLRPGRSLLLAALPEGQDPDSLIRAAGPEAMRRAVDGAVPLALAIWRHESAASPTDTPERRAALMAGLDAVAGRIGDNNVAWEYRRFFRDQFARAFPAGRRRSVGPSNAAEAARPFRLQKPDPALHFARRHCLILVAALLIHPALLPELVESFADVAIADAGLDRLRHALIDYYARTESLDAEELRLHLSQTGHEAIVRELMHPSVVKLTEFLAPGADLATVREGWLQIRSRLEQDHLGPEVGMAKRAFAQAMTEENLERLLSVKELHERLGVLDSD